MSVEQSGQGGIIYIEETNLKEIIAINDNEV